MYLFVLSSVGNREYLNELQHILRNMYVYFYSDALAKRQEAMPRSERGPCEASEGTARAESQRATEAHSSHDRQKNTLTAAEQTNDNERFTRSSKPL